MDRKRTVIDAGIDERDTESEEIVHRYCTEDNNRIGTTDLVTHCIDHLWQCNSLNRNNRTNQPIEDSEEE